MRSIHTLRLIVLCTLALGLSAAAAAHPCDTPSPPSPPTIAGALHVGFCWNGKGADGSPVGLQGVLVIVDGTQIVASAPLRPSMQQGPNRAGLWYYEVPLLSLTPGPHQVAVAIAGARGPGPRSASIAFQTTAPTALPTAPVAVRLLP